MPPTVASLKVVVRPTQTESIPVIEDGEVFTVTTAVEKQLPTVYVIVGVPAATPPTVPAPAPDAMTVAWAVLLLLQMPAAVASLRTVVRPVHTVCVPVMLAGCGFTVTKTEVEHPVGKV